MTLSSLSAHLVAQKGIHGGNCRDLRSKYRDQFSNSVLGVSWSPPDLLSPFFQLQVRPKKSLEKYPKLLAKLQGNDDPDSNSWKTCEDMLDSVAHMSESSPSSENLSSCSSTNSSHLREDSECQSISKQVLSEYPFDYQVYLDKLKAIQLHVLFLEKWNASHLKMCHRNYFVSATNLIHYLALHSLDIQQLKNELSSIGLLNLECANSHVLSSITACIQLLEKQAPDFHVRELKRLDVPIREQVTSQETEKKMELNMSTMSTRASMHAAALLGPVRDKKGVRIMVTVGREAITNEMLLSDLLKSGANIIRINCAHDDTNVWSEIIRRAKRSSQMLEKPCEILMDLAGPKLRTGVLNRGPNVMKISPKKDAKGDVIFPAKVWMSYSGCHPPPYLSPDAALYVESERFLNKLEVGNVVRFVDVRGRKRSFRISEKHSVFAGCGYIAEFTRSAYIESGTRLHIHKAKGRDSISHVVDVPAAEQFIRLRVGDLLTIRRDPAISANDKSGSSSSSALKVTCDSGRLFDSVKPADPIAFDDGKIWGVIQGASNDEIVVAISHAGPKGSKLGSGKSINIPESKMQFEGLTSKDLQDLNFVAANADIVGISFVRDASDVAIVMQELAKRKLQHMGVILKIETRGAFEKLPLLLLQAMQSANPIGVMIARGDLAVECGWDQMACIQEEILSICSAAHIPVIWATQVLESLVKYGIPTRAEITDVASGMRTNCIMLNKGRHIVEAVSSLDSILCNSSTEKNMKTLLKPLLPSR